MYKGINDPFTSLFYQQVLFDLQDFIDYLIIITLFPHRFERQIEKVSALPKDMKYCSILSANAT